MATPAIAPPVKPLLEVEVCTEGVVAAVVGVASIDCEANKNVEDVGAVDDVDDISDDDDNVDDVDDVGDVVRAEKTSETLRRLDPVLITDDKPATDDVLEAKDNNIVDWMLQRSHVVLALYPGAQVVYCGRQASETPAESSVHDTAPGSPQAELSRST